MVGTRSTPGSCARLLVALLPALTTVGACGAGEAPGPARRVILITCDTLRADRLGAYGNERGLTPHLDALASEAIVVEEAYSCAPVTGPALSSLMTGLPVDAVGVGGGNRHFLPASVQTLAEIAADAGLATGAVVSNWVLRRPDAQRDDVGLVQGFAHYDDRMTERERNRESYERLAPDTTDAALAWVDARAAQGEERWLLWVHYQDPHGPYTPPADFAARLAGDPGDGPPLPISDTVKGKGRIPSYQVLGEERRPGVYRDLYDAEVAFFDEQLGRLLDGLSRRGLLDDALLVFTADHGESLGEHDYWFCHGENTHRETVRVPLLVKPPRDAPDAGRAPAPGTRRRFASHLDVLPTVLAALGLPARELPGLSLLDAGDPDRFVPQSLGLPGAANRWLGLGNGRWRLVVDPADRAALYDLAADPDEAHDVAAQHPDRVLALRRLYGRLIDESGGPRSGVERALSAEDEAAFRALGYLGTSEEGH